MKSTIQDVLTLQPTGDDCFQALHHKENFKNTLFGGQVLAQALMACGMTIDSYVVHSMHAYFLRPGDSSSAVDYRVVRNRDGRSFCSRTVNAYQHGKCIFTAIASFHKPEAGFEHAVQWSGMPIGPDGGVISPTTELVSVQSEVSGEAFDFINVSGGIFTEEAASADKTRFWMRCNEQTESDRLWQACALAYASDFGLLGASLVEHPVSLFKGKITGASVDHAIWFHNLDFCISKWLLYEIDSPWAGGARGFSQGKIFDGQGRYLASTSQEGLIRPISVAGDEAGDNARK